MWEGETMTRLKTFVWYYLLEPVAILAAGVVFTCMGRTDALPDAVETVGERFLGPGEDW